MAIIGAIDSGLRNDHDVLVMKGIIDGFTSIILSSTLGIGVAFAAVPVFLYQSIITLFSTQISRIVPDELLEFFISEMTATGGLMIVAIGLNLIGLTKIRVANLNSRNSCRWYCCYNCLCSYDFERLYASCKCTGKCTAHFKRKM